jgi:1,4-dihydroxy-2-naphthoate octaprenyltransferase
MPLGEFTSGVVMGILLPIAVYAAITGEMYWQILFLCLPLMMGIAMIMLTNNSCDIERDSKAGRKTLPVLLGRSRIRVTHRMLLLVWLLSVLVLSLINFKGGLFILPLGLLAGRQSLLKLFSATLTPIQRGYYMKDIFQANLYINGTYILCALLESLHL